MKTEKSKSYPDRINLSPDQSTRVEAWQKQIESAFQGALKIGRSELVNFILDTAQETLSQPTLSKLFNQHFDEIRFLTWAKSKILEAKREGRTVTLDTLRTSLNSGALSTESTKVSRKRTKRTSGNEIDVATGVSTDVLTAEDKVSQ